MWKRIKRFFGKNKGKVLMFSSFIFLSSTLLLTISITSNIVLSLMSKVKENLGATVYLLVDPLAEITLEEYRKVPKPDDALIELLKNDPRILKTEQLSGNSIIIEELEAVDAEIIHFDQFTIQGHTFSLEGVNDPHLRNDKPYANDLVSGRTFTQEEIDKGDKLIIIPDIIANKNGVKLGDTVTLRCEITDFDPRVPYTIEQIKKGRELFAVKTIEVKIIGFYHPKLNIIDKTLPTELQESIEHQNDSLQNVVFTPMSIVADFDTFNTQERQQHGIITGWKAEHTQIPTFIFKSPDDIEGFINDYKSQLPQYYKFQANMENYNRIAIPLQNVLSITNRFIYIILILYLFIVMALCWNYGRDRQKESALLLALGETKKNVILQLITEISLLAGIGILIAFTVVAIFGTNISANIITKQYQQEIKTMDEVLVYELVTQHNLTAADIRIMAKNALSFNDFVLLLYLMAITIFIVAIMNILYIYRLSPRKILIE